MIALLTGVSGAWADVTTPSFTAIAPKNLTAGWYQIKWIGTNGDTNTDYTDGDVSGKFVTNYQEDVTVSASNYSLFLSSAPTTATEHAKTFVYYEQVQSQGDYGTSGYLRSANGHYVTQTGAASATMPGAQNYIIYFSSRDYPDNSVITSGTSGNRYSLIPCGKNATPYIGQTAQNKFPMVQFSKVTPTDLGLQPWTVTMSGVSGTNAQISYTGSGDLYGLTRVYNNGTFFFSSETTPLASDFTGTQISNITPTITIDSENHTINVAYKVTVTYQIVWDGALLSGITEDAAVTRGDALVIPSALQRDDCTYTYYTDAACESEVSNLSIDTEGPTKTIYVKCVWNRYFTPSTPANPVYYALKISGNAGSWWKPNTTTLNSVTATYAHCVANDNVLPDGDATTWAWILEGNPYNGFKIYSVSESKYLGGRTARAGYFTLGESASANAFVIKASNIITFYDETYNLYIDRASGYAYAHSSGQNMTFQRLYKVKFALDTEEAGLQVGSDEVADFDTDYIITTSASLSTTNASYKIKTYDGYSTLADALTNDNDGTINIVTDLSKSITYNLTWNGTPIASKASAQSQWVGDDVLDATTVFGAKPLYCDYGTPDISTIGESTTEVNISLDWDGPFSFSNSFNDAIWYNLKINGDYLIYSSVGNYQLDSSISNAESAGYDAFWAFMGNPIDGVQIINKSAGEGKSLAPFTPSPSMAAGAFPWAIRQWSTNFSLDWSYNYLNNVDGVFKLYNSSTTSGDPTNVGCSVENASYRGLALNLIDEYASSHALGHYFGVSTDTYNSVRAGYADASSVSASDYSQLESFIGGMLPASYPETGYYRIKSNSGRYIGYGQPVADPMPSVGLRTVSAEDAARDASTIIRLVKGVSGHQYTMSTEDLNVQSMQSANTPFPANDEAGVTFVLTASTTAPGKGTIYNATSNDEGNVNVNGYLHEADWTIPGVVNWNETAASSQWEIEDASTVTVPLTYISDNNASYATLYLPFGATITGAKAYILTVSGEWAIPSEITEIPANTGVLLRAEGNVASATVTIKDDASAETAGNMLDGTNVDITAARSTGEYILGNGEDGLGFYKRKSGRKIGANKAYLQLDADLAASVKGLLLNFDIATGIDGLTPDTSLSKKGEEIFNLAGQRMSRVQKGVNIVNGKKVLVK